MRSEVLSDVPALGGGKVENEYYMCSIVVAEGCERGKGVTEEVFW